MAVRGERLQILGDGALAGLVDFALGDDLDRRCGLCIRPADVGAGDLDPFQCLCRRRRRLRHRGLTGAQQDTAARNHQPCTELRLSQHELPPVNEFDRKIYRPRPRPQATCQFVNGTRHTEKACKRIVMCRRERARSGYLPIAWRRANWFDATGLVASPLMPGTPGADRGVRGASDASQLYKTNVFEFTARGQRRWLFATRWAGCRRHPCFCTQTLGDATQRGRQPQAMNAWRRSTSSCTFAPTGNVTLVAT